MIMKVYVITALDGEPYSETTWVDSVWINKEKAEEYLKNNSGAINTDPKNYDYGYYLSSFIQEVEIQ